VIWQEEDPRPWSADRPDASPPDAKWISLALGGVVIVGQVRSARRARRDAEPPGSPPDPGRACEGTWQHE
jgi:hypothetical protein